MKIAILMLGALMVAGCSSAPPKRVQTFADALKDNPDLESGIYERRDGTDVSVEVQSLRSKLEEAEKKRYEAERAADYAKRELDNVKAENQLLRVRGNYKLEKQVNELQGFDNQNNPIIKARQVKQEPEENALRYEQVQMNSVRPRPSPTRIPASDDSQ